MFLFSNLFSLFITYFYTKVSCSYRFKYGTFWLGTMFSLKYRPVIEQACSSTGTQEILKRAQLWQKKPFHEKVILNISCFNLADILINFVNYLPLLSPDQKIISQIKNFYFHCILFKKFMLILFYGLSCRWCW